MEKNRISQLHAHLCPHATASTNPLLPKIEPMTEDHDVSLSASKSRREEFLKKYKNLLDLPSRIEIMNGLPSRIHEGASLEEEFNRSQDGFQQGDFHLNMQELAQRYANHSDKGFSNTFVPFMFTPLRNLPHIDWLVILGNPEDARRIAQNHVKKSVVYGASYLGRGVLATPDNESWREQRKQLSDSFLPMTNLRRIFPTSLARAKYAISTIIPQRINEQSSSSEGVEINEFLLYEAMAQLQLTLFGDSEEHMNESNKPLREYFKTAGFPSKKDKDGNIVYEVDYDTLKQKRREAKRYIQGYSNEVLEHGRQCMKNNGESGPLMEGLLEMCPFGKQNPDLTRDCTSTFLFAGHDTTANLMTHFMYEMARHPDWQQKVRSEVDQMFERAHAEKRDISYDDLATLMEMKRCINETLRLWPSVPNGTFRELEFDEYVQGLDNQRVKLAKGTQVIIPTWLFHRNPYLWGDDVNEFKPDRQWTEEENWSGAGLSGKNPESYRFVPFTMGPRDCMGKNFAQMEARVILSCLLRKYEVTLGDKSRGHDLLEISKNAGTLGPKDGLYTVLTERPCTL